MRDSTKCDNVVITKTGIKASNDKINRGNQHSKLLRAPIEFARKLPSSLRDNTAQTALELEILYACDMLL